MNSRIAVAFLILAALASGCVQQQANDSIKLPKENNVNIQNSAFSPAEITITKGTAITWTNLDITAHTATGTGFDSGALQQGQSWSHAFNDTGTFDYICSIHPGMKGRVVVK